MRTSLSALTGALLMSLVTPLMGELVVYPPDALTHKVEVHPIIAIGDEGMASFLGSESSEVYIKEQVDVSASPKPAQF